MTRSNKLDTKKIEKAAVLGVMSLIQPCETIDYTLTIDDKNPLIDGVFQLYDSHQLSKDHLIANIDIQIKGTARKLSLNSKGTAKFNIDVADLKGWLRVHAGILFFVVGVGRSQGYAVSEKVYCAQLLPYDIHKILSKTAPNQKTVTVKTLKPFPDSPREILRLVSSFYSERERQRRATISGYGLLSENGKLPSNITKVSMFACGFPNESITSLAPYQNGLYVYGEDDKGRTFVLDKIENVRRIAIEHKATIEAGNFKLETQLQVSENENEIRLVFEGIELIQADNKLTLNYDFTGDFRKRYNTIRFVREFLKSGALTINGNKARCTGKDTESKDALEQLEEPFKAYESAVTTLDTLGITTQWDPEQMSDKELRTLQDMHRLLIEKKPYSGEKLDAPIIRFDIQDASVYAIAKENNDGTYSLTELQSKEVFFVFGVPDDRASNDDLGFDPVPPIVAMGKKDYKRIINPDPKKLQSAFTKFPVTEANQEGIANKLLEMLSAYDSDCMQPDALLACAAVLARKLLEYQPDSETHRLNLLQTIRRKRELQDDEKKELRKIAAESELPLMKAAAFALLGDMDMALEHLNQCADEDKRQIEDYPISIFFRQRKEDDNG